MQLLLFLDTKIRGQELEDHFFLIKLILSDFLEARIETIFDSGQLDWV